LKQVTNVKSHYSTVRWLYDEFEFQHKDSLERTMFASQHVPTLEKADFLMEVNLVSKLFDENDGADCCPLIRQEAQYALDFGTFIWSLVGKRVKRMAWLHRSWPGKLTLLSHPSEKLRAKVLEELKLDKEIYDYVCHWDERPNWWQHCPAGTHSTRLP
jgi:hypothetical protein